jgi:hypothetical protein
MGEHWRRPLRSVALTRLRARGRGWQSLVVRAVEKELDAGV